jgi:hypothetical protein
MWHGRVPVSKSDQYLKLMQTIAIPDDKSTPGNRGAFALREIQGDAAHFVIPTFWKSREAIARFAGNNIESANYSDFDRDFLLELEASGKHYELYDNAEEP